ncbi:hypothetical protein EJ05DRAFT_494523 [Pseudovirgaria hyperparasitica]|uniref:BZIP domain-containing protein n=1 Tax=Pseudovirgaria hyperparasitica TaxID=470096 RepID=A0A6A6VW48_9PEZI|nr:uncharacterized protein EJ05DRAFT_494523 [Pseudovirgaria hyperparasitica]KAF2754079.1 hypothetical protein EJ05DRAFT_494523 [Pseudovirgaria hyperparasitica]
MAFSDQMDFRRPPSTIAMDRKPSLFFDDALYEGLESSTPVPGSATTLSPTFSPDSFGLDDYSQTAMVDRTLSTNNPFLEASNNPYRHSMNMQHQQSWPMSDSSSGTRTPTASHPFDNFNPGPVQFMSNASDTSSFHGMSGNNVRPSSVFPPTPMDSLPTPMSPHSNKEWMEMNQMEHRAGPKRMRPNTPPRSYSPFRRGDGIRKKNARFDIPQDRNLLNIDNLIASCEDADELKELKQQKRLLRNRQAALDSRQRKKKHTEDLEEEKKMWSERLTQMEDEVQRLSLACQQVSQEKEMWRHQCSEGQHIIESLNMEKEDMIRTHTLETGELRKKNSILTEKLEAATSGAMSVAPSTTSFSDFPDMDNLNMGASDWDNYIFVDEYAEQQPGQHVTQPQPETSLVVSHRSKDLVSEQEKPVASGLLLMLLLCGAFVASKSSGNSSPPMPRMPEEVRAASATVLDTIFKDAGVAKSPSTENFIANRVQSLGESAPSGVAWPQPNDFKTSLDQHFNQLSAPTKDQEAEAAFGMTASQYNSLTSTDFSRRVFSVPSDDSSEGLSPSSQPSYRRNLAESLAAMRQQNKGEGAAEVYTRSLLWDRIPAEVVRDFKRMVEESERIATTSPGGPDTVKCE